MVAMSKLVSSGPPVTFGRADLFGTWRIYTQRVNAKQAGSTTQVGGTAFDSGGNFLGGVLRDCLLYTSPSPRDS